MWMCSILAMVGNDSVLGVALVFGSSGDIMLDIRDDDTFRNDTEIHLHLFKLGAGLFFVQHVLMICQFASYWKSLRAYSFCSYLVVFIALYSMVLPNIPDGLTPLVCVYSFALTTSCFLSINALSPHRALKHEKFNVIASVLFLVSDSLVISKEIKIKKGDPMGLLTAIKSMDPVLLQIIIMVTYYASQMLFANAAYNRYRYRRSLIKRK